MTKLSELNGWAENAPGKKDTTIEYRNCKDWESGFNTALSQVSELGVEVDVEKLAKRLHTLQTQHSHFALDEKWEELGDLRKQIWIKLANALASTMKDWLRIVSDK